MEENNFNQNMNNIDQNYSGDQQNNTSQQTRAHTRSIGPIIGIAIIIVVLIFGGLYYWGAQINKKRSLDELNNTTPDMISKQEDTALQQLQSQSASDEVLDIETDLEMTDLNNLDQELNNIDTELNL